MGFVTLSKEEFENLLPPTYEEVDLPNCKEYVYEIGTDNPHVNVRIYSTIDQTTNTTRGLGKDAIRIVYWGAKSNKPIGKGKKILRVEGATTIQERIINRINEFLNLAQEQEDKNYVSPEYIKAILTHGSVAWMNFAGSLLNGLKTYGSLTDNQLRWVIGDTNPKNQPLTKKSSAQTFEALVKENNPLFYEQYLEDMGQMWEEEPEEGEEVGGTNYDDVPPSSGEGKSHILRKKMQASKKENDGVKFILSDGKDVELIPTSTYEAFKYPFEHFNPVQSLALPFKDEDINLVISANTSAGKTIAMEPFIDSTLSKGLKVLYLAPLRALCQEKFEDWTKRYPNKKVTILTGDYVLTEKMKLELNSSDIIVLTSEMLDSRSRKMESEQNIFLQMNGLILVDESHILTMEERGHAMEVALMRFTKLNQYARVVLVSATMPNVLELGEWLNVLNGKNSVVIKCEWRPVEIQMRFIEHPILTNHRGTPDYWGTQNAKRNLAVDIAMSKPDEMFLLFVADKNTGRDLVKRFNAIGEKAVFHNADLDNSERKEIENAFRNRTQRVLISTSTLAFGSVREGTNITIANGSTKKVESLKIGDAILSYNEQTKLLEQDIVSSITPFESQKEFKITLENDSKIFLDQNHPVYIDVKGELRIKKTKDLKEGDSIVNFQNFI